MRILNRPMFKYGGPIKEGIMHGMKNGGLSKQFNTGLVGDERYPQTGGREHHGFFLPALYAAGRMALRPFGSWAMKQIPRFQRMKYTPSTYGQKGGWQQIASKNMPKMDAGYEFNPNWLGRQFKKDPLYQTVAGGTSMFGKGLKWTGQKAVGLGKYAFGTPSGLLFMGAPVTYMAGKYFLSDGTELNQNQIKQIKQVGPPGGGETSLGSGEAYYEKPPVKKSAEELAAEAKAERTKRLNKYLDTMGYDTAKRDALDKALIDASAIVQGATDEAGSLKKADWSKMINQAIQSTSKRLEKPEQIREAVGLMMAKGDIEKELYDARPGTHLKNAQDMAETLGISVEEAMNRVTGQATTIGDDLQALQILKKGGTLSAKEIEQRLRNFANKNDLDLKQVVSTDQLDKLKEESGDETIDSMTIVTGLMTGDAKADDGLYQIGTEVVLVKDGVPERQW